MADEIALHVNFDGGCPFMVSISKSKSLADLRSEIELVAREFIFPQSEKKVVRLESSSGSLLPDRYNVGQLLRDGSTVCAFSSDSNQHRRRKKKYHKEARHERKKSSKFREEEDERCSSSDSDDFGNGEGQYPKKVNRNEDIGGQKSKRAGGLPDTGKKKPHKNIVVQSSSKNPRVGNTDEETSGSRFTAVVAKKTSSHSEELTFTDTSEQEGTKKNGCHRSLPPKGIRKKDGKSKRDMLSNTKVVERGKSRKVGGALSWKLRLLPSTAEISDESDDSTVNEDQICAGPTVLKKAEGLDSLESVGIAVENKDSTSKDEDVHVNEASEASNAETESVCKSKGKDDVGKTCEVSEPETFPLKSKDSGKSHSVSSEGDSECKSFSSKNDGKNEDEICESDTREKGLENNDSDDSNDSSWKWMELAAGNKTRSADKNNVAKQKTDNKSDSGTGGFTSSDSSISFSDYDGEVVRQSNLKSRGKGTMSQKRPKKQVDYTVRSGTTSADDTSAKNVSEGMVTSPEQVSRSETRINVASRSKSQANGEGSNSPSQPNTTKTADSAGDARVPGTDKGRKDKAGNSQVTRSRRASPTIEDVVSSSQQSDLQKTTPVKADNVPGNFKEAIRSASEYKQLFKTPVCRRRFKKRAVEKSVRKVAAWLMTSREDCMADDCVDIGDNEKEETDDLSPKLTPSETGKMQDERGGGEETSVADSEEMRLQGQPATTTPSDEERTADKAELRQDQPATKTSSDGEMTVRRKRQSTRLRSDNKQADSGKSKASDAKTKSGMGNESQKGGEKDDRKITRKVKGTVFLVPAPVKTSGRGKEAEKARQPDNSGNLVKTAREATNRSATEAAQNQSDASLSPSPNKRPRGKDEDKNWERKRSKEATEEKESTQSPSKRSRGKDKDENWERRRTEEAIEEKESTQPAESVNEEEVVQSDSMKDICQKDGQFDRKKRKKRKKKKGGKERTEGEASTTAEEGEVASRGIAKNLIDVGTLKEKEKHREVAGEGIQGEIANSLCETDQKDGRKKTKSKNEGRAEEEENTSAKEDNHTNEMQNVSQRDDSNKEKKKKKKKRKERSRQEEGNENGGNTDDREHFQLNTAGQLREDNEIEDSENKRKEKKAKKKKKKSEEHEISELSENVATDKRSERECEESNDSMAVTPERTFTHKKSKKRKKLEVFNELSVKKRKENIEMHDSDHNTQSNVDIDTVTETPEGDAKDYRTSQESHAEGIKDSMGENEEDTNKERKRKKKSKKEKQTKLYASSVTGSHQDLSSLRHDDVADKTSFGETKRSTTPVKRTNSASRKICQEGSVVEDSGYDGEASRDTSCDMHRSRDCLIRTEGADLHSGTSSKEENGAKSRTEGNIPATMFSGASSSGCDAEDLGIPQIISRTATKLKRKEKTPTHGTSAKLGLSTTLLDLIENEADDLVFDASDKHSLRTPALAGTRLRLFKETPQGFTNTTKKSQRKQAKPTTKPKQKNRIGSTSKPEQRGLTPQEREIVSARLNLQTLLDDDSFWNDNITASPPLSPELK